MFATSTFTGVRIMNVVAAPKYKGRSMLIVEARRTKASAHPVLQRRWGGPHPAFALLTSHEDQADALFLSIHLNFVPRALLS